MCDNLKRFRSLQKSLLKLMPVLRTGNRRRHFQTLVHMINGIIAAQSCHLSKIASKVADTRQHESRVRQFMRWLSNDRIGLGLYYFPLISCVLQRLAHQGWITLIFDTSEMGRNCLCLKASVFYRNRALPIAWIVRKGHKGHFSEHWHIALLHQVYLLIPQDVKVVFLGDGEFDNSHLLSLVKSFGWLFAVRIAKNRILCENGEPFKPKQIGVARHGYFEVPRVTLKNQPTLGTVHLLVYWDKKHKEPLYFVTNIEPTREAYYWYKKRFGIEVLFSDEKSRGFHIHKSRIADPKRLERLIIAVAIAYIWIIYLGELALQKDIVKFIHRAKRCDLGLFQLGLRTMDWFLNQSKCIPPLQLNLFYNST